jgi:hypothetical protein
MTCPSIKTIFVVFVLPFLRENFLDGLDTAANVTQTVLLLLQRPLAHRGTLPAEEGLLGPAALLLLSLLFALGVSVRQESRKGRDIFAGAALLL